MMPMFFANNWRCMSAMGAALSCRAAVSIVSGTFIFLQLTAYA
jgi:hypothetical protein